MNVEKWSFPSKYDGEIGVSVFDNGTLRFGADAGDGLHVNADRITMDEYSDHVSVTAWNDGGITTSFILEPYVARRLEVEVDRMRSIVIE